LAGIPAESLREPAGMKIAAVANRLEEIRSCSLESNFQKYGVAVADLLLNEIGNAGL
jgi:hypothetical protein